MCGGSSRSHSLVWRVLAGLLVLVLAVGCAGGDQVSTSSGGQVGRAAHDFGATLPARGPQDLMTVDELRPLVAFGYDIREQPVLDPKQFSLATVRGACGGTVATPFATAGSDGTRVFRSTVTLVIEALAEPGKQEAQRIVDEYEADAVAGCPAFDEQIGPAGPSTVTYLKPVALPAIGEERVGWTASVLAPDGKTAYRTTMVVRDGSKVALLVVIAVREVDPTQFGELLRVAAT